jgi:hypothetical protein
MLKMMFSCFLLMVVSVAVLAQQPQQQPAQQPQEQKDSDGVAGWIKDMFGK